MPEALFGLANVLFWLGDLAGTIANCEKAYAGFRRRGDAMLAAGAALSLVGYNKGYLGNTAAARGWLSRAARIIENEVPQLRGELLGATAYVTDDPVESEALARQAAEIGRANGNSDLELMAMHAVGQALVQQGRTEEGMSLLDEAMAGVIGGEGRDPLTVAQVSCMTMVVCGSCFDLERATQWVRSLGDRDPFCSVEEGAAAYRALPAGELAVLPDTGHLITPAAVQTTIEFFERL